MKPNVFLRNKGLNWHFRLKGSEFNGNLLDLLNYFKENLTKQFSINNIIKRLLNSKKIELKALNRYGFVPKEIPNYKELMTNDDCDKVKGYTDGYKQAMEDVLNAL